VVHVDSPWNGEKLMIREVFETALDAGQLETRVGDRWYRCRRNGRTKTWKRDPSRFEIPIKYRWRDTTRVRSEHFESGAIADWFRVVA
jgi:hypothetical protein